MLCLLSKSPKQFEDSVWLDLTSVRERSRGLGKTIVDVQKSDSEESQQDPPFAIHKSVVGKHDLLGLPKG